MKKGVIKVLLIGMVFYFGCTKTEKVVEVAPAKGSIKGKCSINNQASGNTGLVVYIKRYGVMAGGAGKEAPNFKTRDIYGEEIELKSFKGKKNLLIYFSRYIGCSWCQMFVIDIIRNEEKFKNLNTEVILITESEEDVLKKFAPPKERAFIRMVSDPKKEYYKLYDVHKPGKLLSKSTITESFRFLKYLKDYRWIKGGLKGDSRQAPACFVIGKDGIIKFSFQGEGIADSPSIDEIMKLLELVEK